MGYLLMLWGCMGLLWGQQTLWLAVRGVFNCVTKLQSNGVAGMFRDQPSRSQRAPAPFLCFGWSLGLQTDASAVSPKVMAPKLSAPNVL